MTNARLPLRELRRLVGKTQVELAGAMGIAQPTLSRLEIQADMQISTLRRLVSALGGRLEIVANVPEGRITLDEIAGEREREKPAEGDRQALAPQLSAAIEPDDGTLPTYLL
jgi:transcriptional regulator with XRE-family HTH domain